LIEGVETIHVPDFKKLKQQTFANKVPIKPDKKPYPGLPTKNQYKYTILKKPNNKDELYNPHYSFFDRILKSKKKKKDNISRLNYENDLGTYENDIKYYEEYNRNIDECYQKELKKYNEIIKKIDNDYNSDLENYTQNMNSYSAETESFANYYSNVLNSRAPNFLIQYFVMILKYYQIEVFPSLDYEIDYNLETETLIVDYELPNLDQMPQYKGYKFIKSTYTIQPIRLSDSARSKIYDDTIYKIILRIIYTLYKTDFNNYLKSVVLNGYVKFLDKATGKPNVACIASIQTIKEPFMEIDLANVDPKTCFKSMKGIGSSKLSTIVPITPVISLNKQDKRFISPYSVAEKIDSSTNLAAMDWEDFENLIRELFEQEFSSSGGEVKITQASRDGGVDAIAFDPDPIRGGKIVIQAKRYTNTVGVSAVRDLYGTLLNEGANRGILVTTSDYGPDSYDFAKGKPITLLNGGHLLSLLEKHGQKARIDIKEAKLLLNNDSNYHN